MFVRAKKKSENKWQVQIVESTRDGGTVSQSIVRNIGTAFGAEELAKFRAIGEAAIVSIKNARNPVLAFADPAEVHMPARRRLPVGNRALVKDIVEDARIIEGAEDVFGRVFDEMGCDSILDDNADVLKYAVLARIAAPLSKLATSAFIKNQFGKDIPVQKIYRMLDSLADAEDRAKLVVASHSQKVVGGKVDVLFFDVTTLYFESVHQDELRRFGFSKDCKFKETQVVLALVTTTDGLPIAYDLFAGNTFEGHTLVQMMKTFKDKYLVQDLLLVADRGMFSDANLKEMDQIGAKYIVAAKIRTMAKERREAILTNADAYRALSCNNELCWVAEFPLQHRRLIVSYSSARAKKDRSDRKRLIDRLLKKEKSGVIKTKDLIGNAGTKKFLRIKKGFAEIDHERIAADEEWDGLHGVITNLTTSESSSAQVLEKYRGLWQIEEAFRINKHTLKMRPIYHFTPRRIRAHVLLCYLAYAVLRHTQHHLKKRGLSLGVETIRNELNAVQASIVIDEANGKRYAIPSKMSELAKAIYSAFGLIRDTRPCQV